MNPTADWKTELAQLLTKECDIGLDEAERARVNEIVRQGRDQRAFFFRYMYMHAGLGWESSNIEQRLGNAITVLTEDVVAERPSPTTLEPVASSQPVVEPSRATRFARQIDWQRHPAYFLLAVAVLYFGFWLFFGTAVLPWRDNSSTAKAPRATISFGPSVARIAGTVDAVWDDDSDIKFNGVHVRTGQRIMLAQGLAQIAFDAGARVILIGPATFTLEADLNGPVPGGGFLESGSLTARVSEDARGFTVRTPDATLVDLGTEFGVSVSDGASDVAVFEGLIEVRCRDENGTSEVQRLRAGQSVRVTEKRIVETSAQDNRQRFVRTMQQPPPTTSGDVEWVAAAPRSVVFGDWESKRSIRVFPERRSVVLGRDWAAAIVAPGEYNQIDGTRGMVPEGTRVDSYYATLDPPGIKNQNIHCRGTITFARPVLGVIVANANLTETDESLGTVRTSYPADARQVDSPQDVISLSPDRRTLRFDWKASGGAGDQVRVITAAFVNEQERGNELQEVPDE